MRQMLPLFLAVMLTTHIPVDVFAQSIAEIRGVVQDESGGVVPGVTVTATNELTGVQRTTMSDSGGRFNFPSLLVGTYRVEATSEGFRKFASPSVRLSADDVRQVNVVMGVGEFANTVTVSAVTTEVQTVGGALSAVVDEQRIVCDQIGKPLMIHVNTPCTPFDQILKEARPGDIVTHAFRRAGTGGVIGPEGRVSDHIREAANRGVLFDIGHGSGGSSFAATEAALKEKFLPSTISSDTHAPSALGPVFDLQTTMAKLLVLGLPLENVVELVTSAPAKAIHKSGEMGSLKPGSPADVAVFDLVKGDFSLVDSQGEIRKATQKLAPVVALRGGRIP